MLKNLTFAKKLLLGVLAVVLLSSTITTFLIETKSYSSTEKFSKTNIRNIAEINAYKAKQDLDKSVVLSYALSASLETMLKEKQYTKESILEVMRSNLKKSPYVLGLFAQLDSSIYFENNILLAGKNGHDEDGRFAPYVVKTGNTIIVETSTPESKPRPWVDVPRKTGKEFISEPYFFKVDGKNILMVSIAAPLFHEGKFIGSVGADISLESIAKTIEKIKLHESGYGFLLTNKGTMVGHPKRNLLGKNLQDFTKDKKILKITEEVAKNKTYEFDSISVNNGLSSHFFIKPFELSNSNITWALGVTVPEKEYLAEATSLKWFSIIAGFLSFIVVAIVIIISTRKLGKNLDSITKGLSSFFTYLNKESQHSEKINIETNDEFGLMARVINDNVDKTKKLIEEDILLIEDVKRVVEEVKRGSLSHKIDKSTSNQSLEELKVIFNEMLDVMSCNVCGDMNPIQDALKEFQKLNFSHRIKNATGETSKGLNALAEIINEMLVENKSNGLTLEDSSNILMNNVDILSKSSNQAAASLEETAAALEEITSTIINNTENISHMSVSAQSLSTSATQGQALAQNTTTAMDDITEQVTLINEAISVIDQIAFQTNILSLNAAVEAATAGESGKGFAVVAAEVRNLASRSAEAAKEIKDLVENATAKASQGKEISAKMITGYDELLKNITTATNSIDEITNASKEQETGITQINDAITSLDRQTQENAQVATQTRDIANTTLVIAKNVVDDANDKEFIGKDTVNKKELQS